MSTSPEQRRQHVATIRKGTTVEWIDITGAVIAHGRVVELIGSPVASKVQIEVKTSLARHIQTGSLQTVPIFATSGPRIRAIEAPPEPPVIFSVEPATPVVATVAAATAPVPARTRCVQYAPAPAPDDLDLDAFTDDADAEA